MNTSKFVPCPVKATRNIFVFAERVRRECCLDVLGQDELQINAEVVSEWKDLCQVSHFSKNAREITDGVRVFGGPRLSREKGEEVCLLVQWVGYRQLSCVDGKA